MAKRAPPAGRSPADARDLAAAFEQVMQQLLLLGHTLPREATTLTPQQLKILFMLDFLEEPTPMSQLADRLGVTPGTLTHVARRLIEDGALARERSSEDERVVKLSLSESGRAVVIHIRRHRQKLFAQICARLSAADRRRLIASHVHIFETYRKVLAQLESAS